MKLSELWDYVEAAYDAFGDIECYMDVDDDEVHHIEEFICEYDEENNSRRILLLNYELPELHTSAKRKKPKLSVVKS